MANCRPIFLLGIWIAVLLPCVTGLTNIEVNTLLPCSGSEVIFTCTVNQSDSLYWKVPDIDIDSPGYFLSDQVGYLLDPFQNGDVILNLTSTSPFTSTMTTVASPYLFGATVSCQDGTSSEAHVASLVIDTAQGPAKVTNLTVTAMELDLNQNTSTLDAFLSWKIPPEQEDAAINTDFIVIVSPPAIFGSSFNTSDTSLLLNLDFNHKYNISLVASNCFGNSTPVEIVFGQCQLPSLQPNMTIDYYSSGTDGTYIVYSCQLPSSRMKSKCTSGGYWNPDPAEFLCKHVMEIHKDTEDLRDGFTTALASSISVGLFVLVVISITVFSITCVWFQRRKHGTNRRAQSTDQADNDYADGEHNIDHQQYEDNGLVYACIGPNQNHVAMQRVQSTITLYSEVRQMTQLRTDNVGQNSCTNNVLEVDKLLNLNSLLIQLRPHVTEKWYPFGVAIGIPRDVLQQYLSFPPEECMVEMLDYWLRNHPEERKPTWRAVAKALSDIEFHQLAESIMNSYQTGKLPVEVDMDSTALPLLSLHSHGDESESVEILPPPLPPKIQEADVDPPALPPKPKQH